MESQEIVIDKFPIYLTLKSSAGLDRSIRIYSCTVSFKESRVCLELVGQIVDPPVSNICIGHLLEDNEENVVAAIQKALIKGQVDKLDKELCGLNETTESSSPKYSEFKIKPKGLLEGGD